MGRSKGPFSPQADVERLIPHLLDMGCPSCHEGCAGGGLVAKTAGVVGAGLVPVELCSGDQPMPIKQLNPRRRRVLVDRWARRNRVFRDMPVSRMIDPNVP